MFRKILTPSIVLLLTFATSVSVLNAETDAELREKASAEVKPRVLLDAVRVENKQQVQFRKDAVKARSHVRGSAEIDDRDEDHDDEQEYEGNEKEHAVRNEKIQMRRDALMKKNAEAHAQMKANLETKRESMQEEREVKRKALAERLHVVKNERKVSATERIALHIEKLNDRYTDHLLKMLNRFDSFVERLRTRADKASANAYDISAVELALTSAEHAIETARSAVTAQALKVYDIPVTDEATLADVVARVRAQLHADLSGVRTLVRDAHSAILAVLEAIKQLSSINTDAQVSVESGD